jgi:hypothetical protein
MKKVLYSLGLVAIVAGAAVSFQSCNKIKDEIKKNIDPIDYSQPSVTFNVPVVTTTAPFQGFDTATINMDQIIKDEAGVDFSINDISTITINKVVLHLAGADATNNWTNFSDAGAYLNTDKGIAAGKNNILATVTVPDVVSNQYNDVVITGDNNLNLKDYFNGGNTKVYVLYAANARRQTTHPLTMTATLTYTIKP